MTRRGFVWVRACSVPDVLDLPAERSRAIKESIGRDLERNEMIALLAEEVGAVTGRIVECPHDRSARRQPHRGSGGGQRLDA